jgi:hypothetical protein
MVADPEGGDLPQLGPKAVGLHLPHDLGLLAWFEHAGQRPRPGVHSSQLGLDLVRRIPTTVADDGKDPDGLRRSVDREGSVELDSLRGERGGEGASE